MSYASICKQIGGWEETPTGVRVDYVRESGCVEGYEETFSPEKADRLRAIDDELASAKNGVRLEQWRREHAPANASREHERQLKKKIKRLAGSRRAIILVPFLTWCESLGCEG